MACSGVCSGVCSGGGGGSVSCGVFLCCAGFADVGIALDCVGQR